MAWPRTGTGTIDAGSVATGDASTMRWGTKAVVTHTGSTTKVGTSGTACSNFLVVTRINQSRIKDDLPFENGDGVRSGRMQIFHGIKWDITVREDTQMGVPTEGTYIQVCDIAGHIGAIGLTYSAYVMTANVDSAPKQPGERVIEAERIRLIEGGATNI
jgi:hypothetical protein